MIPVAEYEADGATFVVPDLPIVNVMIDSLDDSVDQMDAIAGGESIKITPNQRVAEGVLFANNMIPFSALQGNEGVFSAIGDGFKAAWDWIVGTIKSIWNFFFSRDNAEVAETTKKEIDEGNDKAKKAADGTQTDAEASSQAGKMAKLAEEGGDKATADALKSAKTPQEKRAAIKAALKKLPTLNKTAQNKIVKAVNLVEGSHKAFISIVNKDSPKAQAANDKMTGSDHPAADILIEMEALINKVIVKNAAFEPIVKKVATAKEVSAVIAFGTAINANVAAMKTLGDDFNGKKGALQAVLTKTEDRMKKAKDAKDKAALKSEIDALRVLVNQAVKVAKLIEITNVRLRGAHKALLEMFGL